MMFKGKDGSVLRHDNFVEEGAISDHILVEMKEFVSYLDIVQQSVAKMADAASSKLKNIGFGNVKEIKESNAATEEAHKLYKQSIELKKIQTQADIKLQQLAQAEIKTKKDNLILSQKINAETEKENKENVKKLSYYAQLNEKRKESLNISKELQAKQALGIELTKEEIALMNKSTLETQKYDGQLKTH